MNSQKAAIEYKEGQQILFVNSYRAIIFNITQAALLAAYLYYNQGPKEIILAWLGTIVFITCIRLIHCKLVISNYFTSISMSIHLKIFIFLATITALLWSTIYFMYIPCCMEQHLYVIILVFGGMSAGAATSLSVYLPAFFAYTMSIFMPVILYNYFQWDINNEILATMCLLFLLAITIVAISSNKLLRTTFSLTEQNKNLSDKFEALSLTDPLTGLYNKRHFTKTMHEEYNRAKRNEHSFSLLSIDIDNFKLVNDSFGHPFGDHFLIYTANYLKHYLRRENDIIFRLGGDEFSALILNTTEEWTKEICDQIKRNYLKVPGFEYEDQDDEHKKVLAQVSISVGVVYVKHETSATPDAIIERADQLLYKAKQEGKNCIRYETCL